MGGPVVPDKYYSCAAVGRLYDYSIAARTEKEKLKKECLKRMAPYSRVKAKLDHIDKTFRKFLGNIGNPSEGTEAFQELEEGVITSNLGNAEKYDLFISEHCYQIKRYF